MKLLVFLLKFFRKTKFKTSLEKHRILMRYAEGQQSMKQTLKDMQD